MQLLADRQLVDNVRCVRPVLVPAQLCGQTVHAVQYWTLRVSGLFG